MTVSSQATSEWLIPRSPLVSSCLLVGPRLCTVQVSGRVSSALTMTCRHPPRKKSLTLTTIKYLLPLLHLRLGKLIFIIKRILTNFIIREISIQKKNVITMRSAIKTYNKLIQQQYDMTIIYIVIPENVYQIQ